MSYLKREYRVLTKSELRNITSDEIAVTKAVLVTDMGTNEYTTWMYDSTDTTSTDDGVNVIVTTDGKRYKSKNILIANVKDLQSTLDGKLNTSGGTLNKSSQAIGDTTPSGAFLIRNPSVTNYAIEMGVGIGTNGAWIQSRSPTASTPFMISLNPQGGNVGIAITNPTKQLDVYGDAVFGLTGGGLYTRIGLSPVKFFSTGGNNTYYYNTHASGSIIFKNSVNSSDLFTITESSGVKVNGSIGFGANGATDLTTVLSNKANLDSNNIYSGINTFNARLQSSDFIGDLASISTLSVVDNFQFNHLTVGLGKFLTTDADGNTSWTDLPSSIYDRANHTGTQAISTVTGLQSALNGKAGLSSMNSFLGINSFPLIGLTAQANANIFTPSGGVVLYSNTSNQFGWKSTNGFFVNFINGSNTADRTYTLPNNSGTVALTSDLTSYGLLTGTQTWSGNNTFSGVNTFNGTILSNGSNIGSSTAYFGNSFLNSVYTPLLIAKNSTGISFYSSDGLSQKIKMFDTGNLLLQNGGTFIDAGYKLDVFGDSRIFGKLSTINIATTTNNIGISSSTTNGLKLNVPSFSNIDGQTATSGTVAHSTNIVFGQPTFASTNTGVTNTNASNVYIAGSPIAGTNTTITNPYALYVNSGNSYFGGVNRIATALNIGDGTYSEIKGDLSVFNSTGNSRFLFGQTVGIYGGMQWNFNATDANAYLNISSNLAGNSTIKEQLVLLRNGNIGIGTLNPILPLSISADNNDIGQVLITGKTNINKSLFLGYNTTSNYGVIQSVIQGTGYSNLILNPSGGYIGIGTTSPISPLDVNGNINSNISILATNSFQLNGQYLAYPASGSNTINGRVIQNLSASDGMYIGYGNNTNGATRIYDGGTTNSIFLSTGSFQTTGITKFLFGNQTDDGTFVQFSGAVKVKSDLTVNGANGTFSTQNVQSNLYYLNLTRSPVSLVTAGDILLGRNIGMNNDTWQYWKDGGGMDRRILGVATNSDVYVGDVDFGMASSLMYHSKFDHVWRTVNGSSEKMRLTQSGNLGIGTSSPIAIYGTTQHIAGATGSSLYLTGTSTAGYLTASDNLGSVSLASNGVAPLTFYVNSSEKMRIATNGVGIGTNSPLGKLQVAGNNPIVWGVGGTTANTIIGTGGTSGSSLFINTPSLNTSYHSGLAIDGTYVGQTSIINLKALGVYSGGGYNSHLSLNVTNGTSVVEGIRINQNGQVGIGTTTPLTKLHIVGGVTGTGDWNRSMILEANFPTIVFNSVFNGKYGGIGYDGSSNMNFYVNGSSEDVSGTANGALSIQSATGNVGIGNSNPLSKLDVTGNINVNGQLWLSNGTFAYWDGTYNRIIKRNGFPAFSLGENSTYYDSNYHIFRRPDGVEKFTVDTGNDRILTYTTKHLFGSQTDDGTANQFAGDVKVKGVLRLNSSLTMLDNQWQYWKDTGGTERRMLGMASNNMYFGDIDNIITGSQAIFSAKDNIFFYLNGSEKMRLLSNGKVGIGTSTPQGILDVTSTTSPSYPLPRMTTTEINALTGMSQGAMVYNTTLACPCFYDGTVWKRLSHSAM